MKSKTESIVQQLTNRRNEIKTLVMEVKAELAPVLEDCQIQAGYLRSRKDVNWDCYDIKNWEAMVRSLKRAEKLLMKIKGINL